MWSVLRHSHTRLLGSCVLLTLATFIGYAIARTDSEARTQCVAQCLRTFRSEVSPQLARLLRQNPDLINQACGGGMASATSGVDNTTVAACSSCTDTCRNYGTEAKREGWKKTCQDFCQASKASLSATCLASCAIVSRLLVTNQGQCPLATVGTDAASSGGSSGSDAIACRSDGSPCPAEGDDRACVGGLRPMRCCRNSCGLACTPANITDNDLPPTPGAPALNRPDANGDRLVLNPRHGKAIEIDWSLYNLTGSPDPIVFLLQVRSHLSSRFDSVAMGTSRWTDLAFTTRTTLTIEEMNAGTWYQFRLAAVSAEGFRAYSEASDPVKTAEPERPRPVRDLQEGVSRIHDGVVDVQVLWKPPAISDLPVAKYEISWVEMIGIDKESLTMFNTSVPVKQTEFTLPRLKLGSTYRVGVSAVAHYGSRLELWSKLATLYVTTMRLAEPPPVVQVTTTLAPKPPAAPPNMEDRGSQINDASRWLEDSSQPAHTLDCSCLDRPKTPLVVNQPYYDSGELKLLLLWPSPAYGGSSRQRQQASSYIIKWSQRVCIESAGSAGETTTRQALVHSSLMFNIGGLKFNCHYALQLRGLTNSGDVAFTWNTCFCTRSCKETQIKGNLFPSCPRDEAASAPQPPARLRWTLLRLASRDPGLGGSGGGGSGTFAARISWAAPDHTAMHAISGFRITWGPAEDDGSIATAGFNPGGGVGVGGGGSGGPEPRMDPERSDTSVIDMREREFHLYNLRPGVLYLVAMQTMTVFGDSRAAGLSFLTPADPGSSGSGGNPGGRAAAAPNSEVQKYINNEFNAGVASSPRLSISALILAALATVARVIILRLC